MEADGSIQRGQGEPVVLPAFPGEQVPFLARRGFGGFGEGLPFRQSASPLPPSPEGEPSPSPALTSARVVPYGVSRDRLMQAVHSLGTAVQVVEQVGEADLVLTTKSHFRRRAEPLRSAEEQRKPIYVLRKNTPAQLYGFLRGLSQGTDGRGTDAVAHALDEAQQAVEKVMQGEPSLELNPQGAYVRRLQHQLIERYNLASASTGREPHRRVIVFRP
jgi:hypothetical protein